MDSSTIAELIGRAGSSQPGAAARGPRGACRRGRSPVWAGPSGRRRRSRARASRSSRALARRIGPRPRSGRGPHRLAGAPGRAARPASSRRRRRRGAGAPSPSSLTRRNAVVARGPASLRPRPQRRSTARSSARARAPRVPVDRVRRISPRSSHEHRTPAGAAPAKRIGLRVVGCSRPSAVACSIVRGAASAAVRRVARDRRPGVRELDAGLMRPSRLELELEHRPLAAPRERPARASPPARRSLSRADDDAHAPVAVRRQRVAKRRALALRAATR